MTGNDAAGFLSSRASRYWFVDEQRIRIDDDDDETEIEVEIIGDRLTLGMGYGSRIELERVADAWGWSS